jgi:hypothetical protein
MTDPVYKLEEIEVECYEGYKSRESPRTFSFREKRYQVLEVVDRWYGSGVSRDAPKLDYFKVKADDGRHYLLRYNALFDRWAILLKE